MTIDTKNIDVRSHLQEIKNWLNEAPRKSGGNVEKTISDDFLIHLIKINHIYKPYSEAFEGAIDDLVMLIAYCDVKKVPISKEVLSEIYMKYFNIQIYNK